MMDTEIKQQKCMELQGDNIGKNEVIDMVRVSVQPMPKI